MKLIQSILLAVAAMVSSRRYTLCANTYDAAVETHDTTVRRTADAALSTRHLLVKKGASDGTVAICGLGDLPIGTVDNITADADEAVTVMLLGRGATKKMVASKAIAAGVDVFAAASGKITTVPSTSTHYRIGISLTAAAGDNDIIEVSDGVPVPIKYT